MTSLVAYTLFFLNFLSEIRLQNFTKVCYHVIGYPSRKQGLLFDEKLPFIPEILELGILAYKNRASSKLEFVEKADQYFLIKASFSCIDPLVYNLPIIPENFTNIEFVLTWGKDRIVIDRFQVLLQFDFSLSYHLLIGLLENVKMRVNIKRDITAIRGTFSSSYLPPGVEWSTEVRRLEPFESLCMYLFTKEFDKPLLFLQKSHENIRPLEHYIFNVGIYERPGRPPFEHKTYLAKVFPCETLDIINIEFKIYVDTYTKIIRFQLAEKAHGYHSRILHWNIYGNFGLDDTENPDFGLGNIKIISRPLTQEMADSKTDMILYYSMKIWLPCRYDLPEVLKDLPAQNILEIHSRGVLISRKLRYIDTSKKTLKVFLMRPATESEIEECLVLEEP